MTLSKLTELYIKWGILLDTNDPLKNMTKKL